MNPWKFSIALLALVGAITLGESVRELSLKGAITDGYMGTPNYSDFPNYYTADQTYPV